jgi:hypothetical protein
MAGTHRVVDFSNLRDPGAAARVACHYAEHVLEEIGLDGNARAESLADLERRLAGSVAFAGLLEDATVGDPARALVRAVSTAYIQHHHRERLGAGARAVERRRHQRREYAASAKALEAQAQRFRRLGDRNLALEVAELAEKSRQRAQLLASIMGLEPKGRPSSPVGALRDAVDGALKRVKRPRRAELVSRLAHELLDLQVAPETLLSTSKRASRRR